MHHHRKSYLFLFVLFLCTLRAFGQQDSTIVSTEMKENLTFSGFVDAYYSYDFNRPASKERPDFLYNHKRHNEFNVNLALLKGSYTSQWARASIGLMAGTYSQYNLAHEQEQLRHVWEAHAGIKLVKGLWLDAGVFLSHIGFESAISTENFTLTRSIMAENTPYYLSGAKLSYAPEKSPWALTLVVANGWQNIRETANNTNKGIGGQINYTPDDHLTVNYSTFFSNEYPDWAPRWRYLHNFYAIYHVNSRLGLIAALDTGLETQPAGSLRNWWNTTALVRYQLFSPLTLGGRLEYYSDPTGIMINPQDFATPPPVNPHGFRTRGYSLNLDYVPAPHVMLRVEGRVFHSRDKIFAREAGFSQYNAALTSSIALSF